MQSGVKLHAGSLSSVSVLLCCHMCLQGFLTVSFHDTYYQAAAARFPDQVPPLTAAQQAALSLFNETAGREDVRLDYWLEPGDMQFVNNHNIVHMRSQFEDWEVSVL
jgi:hypothetical protein